MVMILTGFMLRGPSLIDSTREALNALRAEPLPYEGLAKSRGTCTTGSVTSARLACFIIFLEQNSDVTLSLEDPYKFPLASKTFS